MSQQIDYSNMTVLELKALTKDRNVYLWSSKKNKADYVKALRDDDASKKGREDFHIGLAEMAESFKTKTESIQNSLAKIRDACTEFDIKIKSLKEKENKTNSEYELLVKLLESRMKLMKEW